MTPYKQLYRHDPENGMVGDCWRTCIACLLDIQPIHVPHFMEPHWAESDGTKANADTRSWLNTRGLDFVEIAYHGDGDLDNILQSMGALNPGVYYTLGGNSKNGCGHSVICCDDRIVWDPSLDDSGIVGPMKDGYYWIGFLIPLLLRSPA